MRIAIFGSTGAVGRTLLVHMLKGNDLLPGDEIILAGRNTPRSHQKLDAIKTDLLDAFDAGVVTLSVCSSLHDLAEVDIFIMAAGATVGERIMLRSQLAEENVLLFREVAEAAGRRCPRAFFLLISNPVELAVRVFCDYIDRRRIVGMGAQQDSLRFARAIADNLGLPRAAVRASVLGEHGPGMVPLWSSVFLIEESSFLTAALDALRYRFSRADKGESLARLHEELVLLISNNQFDVAVRRLEDAPPDLRILVEPLLTVKLLRSTPNATANATLDCIATIRCGDDRRVHGQVLLDGEFYGMDGVLGVPLALRRSEWIIGTHPPLTEEELERLQHARTEIQRTYSDLLEKQPRSSSNTA